jgi:hypothetical protein
LDFKSRVVPGVLIAGVVLAGGGSVIAASGGSSTGASAAAQQYCPDGSPKPPDHGCSDNNPSNPTCPDGTPKPPDRGCSDNNPGNPNSPPEKHHKKPKYKVKTHPRTGCVNNGFRAQVTVLHKPKGKKTFVYLHGRLVKASSRKNFTVRIPAAGLKPGRHRVKMRVRGADGKWYRRTMSFNVCKKRH